VEDRLISETAGCGSVRSGQQPVWETHVADGTRTIACGPSGLLVRVEMNPSVLLKPHYKLEFFLRYSGKEKLYDTLHE
jgi:hypothetical protein